MIDYVIPAPVQISLPVVGTSARFPVGRVFCIGRNYRWREDEPAPVEMPSWFMKPSTAITPAQDVMTYPPETMELCHEIELVVALGRGGRDIEPARVQKDHIWGYAAGLDLTRRDLQQLAKRAGGPWEPAKAFDQSAPCTAISPVSVCGHPDRGAVWLIVDGETRQEADVSDLLWPVPALVSMLSRSVTLEAGDLIFTGTPAGVGPLRPGQGVQGGVAGVGEFSMTVAAQPFLKPRSNAIT